MRFKASLLVSLCFLVPDMLAAAESLAGRKPNIIFIMTDDQ
jgi:hypothetical protein